MEEPMFKSLKFLGVTGAPIEKKIMTLLEKKTNSELSKLRIDNCLYVQPKDMSEIEDLIASDLIEHEYLKSNNINLEGEPKSIEQLEQENQKEPAKSLKYKATADLDKDPTKKEETKNTEDVKGSEDEVKKSEEQVTGPQGTALDAKAKPPKDFFLTYTDPSLYFPIFLVYLFVIIIIKVSDPFFSK